MANKPNQKLRMLYVLKLFFEETDTENGLTTQQIIDELANLGLEAERKTIHRDIHALKDFGLTIEQRGGREWYLADRPFRIQELIMLVDAVQSTPFLTEGTTDRLIKKIQGLASESQRDLLHRRIEVPGRVKMHNAAALENADIIQQAMRMKRKVSFKYFHYNAAKEKVLNHAGEPFSVTPVRLVYADEFYYLIAFMDRWANVEGHQPFSPFRVDRMLDVRVSDELATKDARIATYRSDEHISPSFGVFAAEMTNIVLEFDERVMNPVIDKFGLDALVFKREGALMQAHVKAPLSPQFFGWLLQLTPWAKIASPKNAQQKYTEWLKDTLDMYAENQR